MAFETTERELTTKNLSDRTIKGAMIKPQGSEVETGCEGNKVFGNPEIEAPQRIMEHSEKETRKFEKPMFNQK